MFELKLPPTPGQVLLYVELSLVENMTIAQCLTLLEEMGYTPELRYRQWKDREGTQHLGLFALLKDEQCDPNTMNPDYMSDEWEALSQRIEPNMAVRSPRGLPKRQPVAA